MAFGFTSSGAGRFAWVNEKRASKQRFVYKRREQAKELLAVTGLPRSNSALSSGCAVETAGNAQVSALSVAWRGSQVVKAEVSLMTENLVTKFGLRGWR